MLGGQYRVESTALPVVKREKICRPLASWTAIVAVQMPLSEAKGGDDA